MYASRSRCDSPARSTFATAFEPSESSALYTSPMQPPPSGRARTSLVPSTASTLSEIRRSAMIREVLLLDLLQKPLRRLLDKLHNVLEALRSSVVGVRHLGLGTPRREVQKGFNLSVASSAKGCNRPVVLLVHGQHVVKAVAVVGGYPSCPLAAEVQAPRARAPLRPLVRGMSDVPGAGAGRIYEDLILQPLAPHDLLEDALSKRGTTYITHTDEQHAYHRYGIYHLYLIYTRLTEWPSPRSLSSRVLDILS